MNDCFDTKDGLSAMTSDLQTRPCKVAFLGNSVTAQKDGFARILADQISAFFPPTHEFIHAGIGGVGSLASCFLLDDFVLKHGPDICFVECTVADIGHATPARYLKPAIEGIIQKLQSSGIRVLFLHLYNTHTPPERADEVISAYQEVLGAYRIPSINVRERIISGILANSFTSTDILHDGVHTTIQGAKTYADSIMKALVSGLNTVTEGHTRLNTVFDPTFRYTRIVLPESLLHETSQHLKRSRFRGLIKCIHMDEAYTFETSLENGTIVGFFIIADQDSGVLHVSYGENFLDIQTYDQWCGKERIQAVLLEEPVRESQKLSISLSSSETAPRGANGTANGIRKKGGSYRLMGLMVAYTHEPDTKARLW